ncbi:Hpy99I family type II restriction endonuclease [Patescibacteria group bacterium]|nr:Hpy99I family type II restriction endonuclease [Patescibacteria group bacterium]
MKQSKVSHGDFVIATSKIENVVENSIGIVKETATDKLTVYFVGSNKVLEVKESNIALIDLEKTGKSFAFKICNICHILKTTEYFDKNQTDAKGRSTTRPSCKECRKHIDGVKLTGEEKQKMDDIRPKTKSIFTCPICKKRTIVGITANLVRDHDHRTGKGREWICDSCNTGLGRFKDDIKFLERVIDYLKKYS